MIALIQATKQSLSKNINLRHLSVSSSLRVKEIEEIQEGDTLTIRGNIVPSGRESLLLQNKDPVACPMCASGLDLKHTDVLILSQFVRSNGLMLPKRITGLCGMQQKRVSILVAMAQKAGLMPNLNPANSNKDPKKRYQWKQFNKYFCESTIKVR